MTIFPLRLMLRRQTTYQKDVENLLTMSESLATILNHLAKLEKQLLPLDIKKTNLKVIESLTTEGDQLIFKLAGFIKDEGRTNE